ncbi:MAG: hypothetical protein JWQ88_1602 [Rhodoferax sp.]|nr:hypothetical protein [Rhodoferax sp.]
MQPVAPARPANYSPNINGFRGICVLLVFLHHVANSGLPPAAEAGSLWQNGVHDLFMSFGYGVELFFMISGYVIVNSLRRHATIGSFLMDRVLRIFPVWVPVALFLFVARGVAGGGFAHDALPSWLMLSLANLLLLPPLLPVSLLHPASWSLTYEWVFYLASALAAVLWRQRFPVLAKLAWGLLVAALIVCYPRSLYFLPGVLVALAPDAVRPLQRTPWLVYLTLPVFLLVWLSTDIFAAQFRETLLSVLFSDRGPAVLVALGAATHVFACVAMAGTPASLGLLRTRAAQHLGTISYSFYLVHPVVMSPVKQAIIKAMPGANGTWAATIAFALVAGLVSWAVSYASWRWLEQGLAKRLKARFAPHPRKSVEAMAA